jgi:hypothetical protein
MAFKSLLSLRSDLWKWQTQPESAIWWVVDGACEELHLLTQALQREKALGVTHGALLGKEWNAVENSIWTFFKVPLQTNQIFQWIDANTRVCVPISTAFAGQRVRLKRWPNISNYGRNASTTDRIQIAETCGRLLMQWMSYEELIGNASDPATMELLLHDAMAHGILAVEPDLTAAAQLGSQSAKKQQPLAQPSDDRSGWSLVRRLIQKFK